ncbi:MAG: YkgJ family cysteine cluster protein, partial [Candidatus Omnitrophota bacterium]
MIKQFVPSRVCLKCRGCCRFIEADSVWQPSLLENEAEALSKNRTTADYITKDKRICLIPSKNKDIFYCAFFDTSKNKCKIYLKRPLECQMYPFLINRRDNKIFLSVDLNCPFIKESLLQNTSNLSFCGSPRGEAEGLTAESIKILSSIIDPALSRRMTEIE